MKRVTNFVRVFSKLIRVFVRGDRCGFIKIKKEMIQIMGNFLLFLSPHITDFILIYFLYFPLGFDVSI